MKLSAKRTIPLISLFFLFLNPLVYGGQAPEEETPSDNPVERYGIEWTNEYAWAQLVNILDIPGGSWDEKVERAQAILLKKGAGVIFFPAGDYTFKGNIRLRSNIVLRGSIPIQTEKWNPVVPEDMPALITDAREARYTLGTRFHFPAYEFKESIQESPVESAFKGIMLADNERDHHCGVVHINIDNGHIEFGTLAGMQKDYRSAKELKHYLVYGCILSNCATPRPGIPAEFQHPWQIFTDADRGAVTIYASGNVLIANNRIPESGQSNFTMERYRVYPDKESMADETKVVETEVCFDFDNRSGIRVNPHPALSQLDIWYRHEEVQEAVDAGTIEKLIAPGSLAKGIVIRENYIFSTGRAAIKTGGDGSIISYNVIRFKPSVVRPTSEGIRMDGFSNGNRAIEVRGWRWTMEGNDFEVHSNYTPDGIKYNDGEGLMHEAWENVGVRDSKMINNTGNRYLCFWRVPVKGLIIKGNHIRLYHDFHSIYVNSQARISSDHFVDLPCERVEILDNLTEKSGIKIIGLNGSANRIEGNRHAIPGEGLIEDFADCELGRNEGYQIVVGE